jgi:hypothetical protein
MDCHSDGTGDGGLVGLEFVKTPGRVWAAVNLEMHCAGQHAEHGPAVHGLGVCWGEGQLIDPPWIVLRWSLRNTATQKHLVLRRGP